MNQLLLGMCGATLVLALSCVCVDGRHQLWQVQHSSFRWLYNGLVSRLQQIRSRMTTPTSWRVALMSVAMAASSLRV